MSTNEVLIIRLAATLGQNRPSIIRLTATLPPL